MLGVEHEDGIVDAMSPKLLLLREQALCWLGLAVLGLLAKDIPGLVTQVDWILPVVSQQAGVAL